MQAHEIAQDEARGVLQSRDWARKIQEVQAENERLREALKEIEHQAEIKARAYAPNLPSFAKTAWEMAHAALEANHALGE